MRLVFSYLWASWRTLRDDHRKKKMIKIIPCSTRSANNGYLGELSRTLIKYLNTAHTMPRAYVNI